MMCNHNDTHSSSGCTTLYLLCCIHQRHRRAPFDVVKRADSRCRRRAQSTSLPVGVAQHDRIAHTQRKRRERIEIKSRCVAATVVCRQCIRHRYATVDPVKCCIDERETHQRHGNSATAATHLHAGYRDDGRRRRMDERCV